MNEIIQGMVKGYMDLFDNYQLSPQLQSEVQDLSRRFYELGQSIPDPTHFYGQLVESGLQEEYSALITRAAMADMGTADADGKVKTDYSDSPAAPPLSVKDFVEQYRIPYEEVKKAGYRKNAQAAYEAILDIPNQTDDMLEAQLILEEEGLLWKIVKEDGLDIFAPILEAMDPLQEAMTAGLELQIRAFQASQSIEDLDYHLEKLEFEKYAMVSRFSSRMSLTIQLTALLMDYAAHKMTAQLSGGKSQPGRQALKAMIGQRLAIRRTLTLLKDQLNLTFDDLLDQEAQRIWMLVPQHADELGRFKVSLHPQNLQALKEMVDQEIMSDLSIMDLLRRENDQVLWYALLGQDKSAFEDKAQAIAQSENASLTYYQYKESLDQSAGPHMPKKETKSKIPLQAQETSQPSSAAGALKGFLKKRFG